MAKEPAKWIARCLKCQRSKCNNCLEYTTTKKERIELQIEEMEQLLTSGYEQGDICAELGISIATYNRRMRVINERRQQYASQ